MIPAADMPLRYKIVNDVRNRLKWWGRESDVRFHDYRFVLDTLTAELNHMEAEELIEQWEGDE